MIRIQIVISVSISHKLIKSKALLSSVDFILGDPGAVSWVDKMFVLKVYCTIETSPWALSI